MRTAILIRSAAIAILLFEAAVLCLLLFADPVTSPFLAWHRGSLVTSFATCRDLGFPVEGTAPLRCAAGGKTFYEADLPLRLLLPERDSVVGLPLEIRGELKTGSGTRLTYDLLDADGFSLVEDRMPIPKALSGQIVPIGASVSFPRPMGTGGTLLLSLADARGTVVRRISVPVRFLPEAAVDVKAFFGSTERDPSSQACDVSYPVARRVAVSENLEEASLRELLRGPTLTEERQGFFTNIPEGTALEGFRADEGRALLSFAPPLPATASGSCKAQAIRSQIERTLKQFPSVKDVEIVEDAP